MLNCCRLNHLFKKEKMKYRFLILVLIIVFNSCSVQKKKSTSEVETNNWEFLLDENLSKWDAFIGVPHYSVDLEGYEKGDGMKGTPIGLNKDPLNVFSAEKINDEVILNITGEVYGGLSTKKEYENYHISFEFKWGTKKYEPRLKSKRDNGILYHAQEPHGQFWNVWMRAPEMQVQEGDCGDFFPLAGVAMDVRATKAKDGDKEFWFYDPKGELRNFATGKNGRCRRMVDNEKPYGEWNTLELICIGDKAYHIVNGKVVMVLENSVEFKEDGSTIPLTKGKIQIQSEAAEAYYKNIKIRSINKLPKMFEN